MFNVIDEHTERTMDTEDFVSLKICTAIATAVLLVIVLSAAPGTAQTVSGSELPVVWVLSTGGTIAGAGASATDLSNYKSGSLPGEEIVRSVPQIKQFANVTVEQIVNIPSQDMTLDNWITLSNRINKIFAEDANAGIVVMHGTSTLEETAYFLNLTVKYDNNVYNTMGLVTADNLSPQKAQRLSVRNRPRGAPCIGRPSLIRPIGCQGLAVNCPPLSAPDRTTPSSRGLTLDPPRATRCR